jgi:3-methyl-2-oxobutanoate hydroxymethyltransferase
MRVSINQIKEMKQKGEKISIPVTMADMLHHAKVVVRGSKKAMVIGDMPFMTYTISTEDALRNATRFLQEAGVQAVKLEGGVTVAEKVQRIVSCGIPVMGHIGLTPQSIHQFGGHKIQGKTPEVASRLLEDAKALEKAGAFAIVLETVPAPLAALITKKVSVPTIGIGAGINCDGQVQVITDILGSTVGYIPKHAKQYAKLSGIMSGAVAAYYEEVKSGKFPTEAQSFPMDESILAGLDK